jgi:hypothetical protein
MSNATPGVTKIGVVDMQVCVPEDWIDERIIRFAETKNPSGTYGWHIRKEGSEALAGCPERNPCAQRAGYVHIMLDA